MSPLTGSSAGHISTAPCKWPQSKVCQTICYTHARAMQKPLLITTCRPSPSPTPFSVAPFPGAAPRTVHSTHDHLFSSNLYIEVSSSGAPCGNGHLETSLLTPQHVPSWVRLTPAKLLTPPFPAFREPLPLSAALDQHRTPLFLEFTLTRTGTNSCSIRSLLTSRNSFSLIAVRYTQHKIHHGNHL